MRPTFEILGAAFPCACNGRVTCTLHRSASVPAPEMDPDGDDDEDEDDDPDEPRDRMYFPGHEGL